MPEAAPRLTLSPLPTDGQTGRGETRRRASEEDPPSIHPPDNNGNGKNENFNVHFGHYYVDPTSYSSKDLSLLAAMPTHFCVYLITVCRPRPCARPTQS